MKPQHMSLFLLRIVMGWMFLYAGVTKVINPSWSAEGYIKGAKTFAGFYQLLLDPSVLPAINFLNEWGLTLLGVSLLFGLFVRLSSVLGVMLMLLYYFVVLAFPYPNPNAFLVDQHIVYALVLALFAEARAGRFWGLDDWCAKLPICAKYPRLREWLG